MKKYQHKIIIINRGIDKNEYPEIKKLLYKTLSKVAENMLSWDCIIYVYLDNKNSPFDAETSTKNKKYSIFIHQPLLKVIKLKKYKYLYSTMCHEIVHILDHQKALDCPYTTYDFSNIKAFSKEEHFAKKAFSFWTEYNAFSLSLKLLYKSDSLSPNLYNLTHRSKEIIKNTLSMAKKSDAPKEDYSQWFREVREIIYETSLFMAFDTLFPNHKKYSEKTQTDEIMSVLVDFMNKAKLQMEEINRVGFDKDFDEKFINLGKLIFKYFYEIFGCSLQKDKKYYKIMCSF